MESHQIPYQRSISFNSQAKLFSWINRSRASHLQRVRTLTLRLTDVDLTSLLEQDDSKRRAWTSASSMYQHDLEKLEQSLADLPSLSSLTIIPPKMGRSQLLKGMYHSFLAEIPRRCTKLRRLELHDSEELLETVPELKEVQNVKFVGSVSKSGSETKDIKLEPETTKSLADTETTPEAAFSLPSSTSKRRSKLSQMV